MEDEWMCFVLRFRVEWRDFYLNYSQFEIDLSILVRAPALNLRCLAEPEFDEVGHDFRFLWNSYLSRMKFIYLV